MNNIWAMAQDKRQYANPERFWPERFETGKEIVLPSSYVFGVGRRTCAGRYWAEPALFITVASVLATFNISKARDQSGNEIEPPRTMIHGLVNRPTPFKCDIKPRSDVAVALIRAAAAQAADE